ncbi:MAG: DUF2461 domain-containing protein [Bacteroidota bacterium]|nr:DUF2461 domain-containing protein [Bacteroidota bacterium]
MKWFTPDLNLFFKELARNNNKEWFDANRKRYEESVKKPFEVFVAELIARIAKLDPAVKIEPKDAIFRINKDVRFSKDKMPYKLNTSAIVSPGGRKDHGVPGVYLELGPEHVQIFGGSYTPEKEQLHQIRTKIASELKTFKKLYAAKDFVDHFGSIQGEKNKVLPPEFKELAKTEPLIANKQFYYSATLPAKSVSEPDLIETIMRHYKAMWPMNAFLATA